MADTQTDDTFGPLSCFDVEIADRVAHVRLNRPEKHNSMIAAFWSELPRTIDRISRDASARVIVISSTGKTFSSGMDLSVFAGQGLREAERDLALEAEYFIHKVAALQDTFTSLERARMPVLCAIQGGVIGGAVDLVTAADCRWATSNAFFQIQEVNVGMTADVGTFPRLQRLIPEGVARELAFTGRRMPAEEALKWGLVNGVVETEADLMETVLKTARDIAAKDPLAVTGVKQVMNYGREHSVADTLSFVGAWNAGMLSPAHMMEAILAFKEKRAGRFADLKPIPDEPL